MIMKIKWKVMAKPTGPYSSFQKRGWPHATFADGANAGFIECTDSYTPALGRGEYPHAELVLWVPIKRQIGSGFDNRRLTKRAATLAEAKAFIEEFWSNNMDRKPD